MEEEPPSSMQKQKIHQCSVDEGEFASNVPGEIYWHLQV
jgi:hypothetical protein